MMGALQIIAGCGLVYIGIHRFASGRAEHAAIWVVLGILVMK